MMQHHGRRRDAYRDRQRHPATRPPKPTPMRAATCSAEGSRALTASHVGFECCWKSRVLMIVVDKGVVLMSRCWAADGRKR